MEIGKYIERACVIATFALTIFFLGEGITGEEPTVFGLGLYPLSSFSVQKKQAPPSFEEQIKNFLGLAEQYEKLSLLENGSSSAELKKLETQMKEIQLTSEMKQSLQGQTKKLLDLKKITSSPPLTSNQKKEAQLLFEGLASDLVVYSVEISKNNPSSLKLSEKDLVIHTLGFLALKNDERFYTFLSFYLLAYDTSYKQVIKDIAFSYPSEQCEELFSSLLKGISTRTDFEKIWADFYRDLPSTLMLSEQPQEFFANLYLVESFRKACFQLQKEASLSFLADASSSLTKQMEILFAQVLEKILSQKLDASLDDLYTVSPSIFQQQLFNLSPQNLEEGLEIIKEQNSFAYSLLPAAYLWQVARITRPLSQEEKNKIEKVYQKYEPSIKKVLPALSLLQQQKLQAILPSKTTTKQGTLLTLPPSLLDESPDNTMLQTPSLKPVRERPAPFSDETPSKARKTPPKKRSLKDLLLR